MEVSNKHSLLTLFIFRCIKELERETELQKVQSQNNNFRKTENVGDKASVSVDDNKLITEGESTFHDKLPLQSQNMDSVNIMESTNKNLGLRGVEKSLSDQNLETVIGTSMSISVSQSDVSSTELMTTYVENTHSSHMDPLARASEIAGIPFQQPDGSLCYTLDPSVYSRYENIYQLPENSYQQQPVFSSAQGQVQSHNSGIEQLQRVSTVVQSQSCDQYSQNSQLYNNSSIPTSFQQTTIHLGNEKNVPTVSAFASQHNANTPSTETSVINLDASQKNLIQSYHSEKTADTTFHTSCKSNSERRADNENNNRSECLPADSDLTNIANTVRVAELNEYLNKDGIKKDSKEKLCSDTDMKVANSIENLCSNDEQSIINNDYIELRVHGSLVKIPHRTVLEQYTRSSQKTSQEQDTSSQRTAQEEDAYKPQRPNLEQDPRLQRTQLEPDVSSPKNVIQEQVIGKESSEKEELEVGCKVPKKKEKHSKQITLKQQKSSEENRESDSVFNNEKKIKKHSSQDKKTSQAVKMQNTKLKEKNEVEKKSKGNINEEKGRITKTHRTDAEEKNHSKVKSKKDKKENVMLKDTEKRNKKMTVDQKHEHTKLTKTYATRFRTKKEMFENIKKRKKDKVKQNAKPNPDQETSHRNAVQSGSIKGKKLKGKRKQVDLKLDCVESSTAVKKVKIEIPEMGCDSVENPVANKNESDSEDLETVPNGEEVINNKIEVKNESTGTKVSKHKKKHFKANSKKLQNDTAQIKCETCGLLCNKKGYCRFCKIRCPFCDKSFTRSKSAMKLYQTHVKTHIDDPKPYPCSACDMKFSSEWFLNRHIDNKHIRRPDAGPFVCEICNKHFTTSK